MPDVGADLIRTARDRVAKRPAGNHQVSGHDYPHLAELFRRHTTLDGAGLGPELARIRNGLNQVPPQPPTIRGKLLSLFGRVFSPLLWGLLRTAAPPNALEAVYETMLCQLEWQLASEERMAKELAAIRTRLEALEASLNGRGQPH